MKKNIIALAGAPCSGKTSVGRILSDLLYAVFIDTDTLIENKRRQTVQWIFKNEGEDAFRKLEKDILIEVIENADGLTVVALGGGTLLNPGSLSLVNRKAIVFTLFATANTLVARNNGNRPLAEDPDVFKQLIHRREDHYLSLDNRIDTESRNPEQVAAVIRRAALPLLSQ
jgi:shikimate kinase